MAENIVKEYTKEDFTIIWQPSKCIHSAKCWKALPTVFNPKEKPWIKLDSATKYEIINQVKLCPSKALSIKGDVERIENIDEYATEIIVIKSGPIKISGQLNIKFKDGKSENQKEIYLCRCGQSENKPFCDGAHKKCGFIDE